MYAWCFICRSWVHTNSRGEIERDLFTWTFCHSFHTVAPLGRVVRILNENIIVSACANPVFLFSYLYNYLTKLFRHLICSPGFQKISGIRDNLNSVQEVGWSTFLFQNYTPCHPRSPMSKVEHQLSNRQWCKDLVCLFDKVWVRLF